MQTLKVLDNVTNIEVAICASSKKILDGEVHAIELVLRFDEEGRLKAMRNNASWPTLLGDVMLSAEWNIKDKADNTWYGYMDMGEVIDWKTSDAMRVVIDIFSTCNQYNNNLKPKDLRKMMQVKPFLSSNYKGVHDRVYTGCSSTGKSV